MAEINNTKIIAFYLPQFHEIPENNKWWGKGFTEWFNVKKAKPLYKGHNQPRVPLNKNYYNLLDTNTIKQQAKVAKKYGIYGFCFYHYWFDGKKLLEKPAENMLNDSEINFPYCLSWANESWTNAWKPDEKSKVLMQQKYGDQKSWKKHFDYLLQFFNDPNYIKEDGKPLFVIYRPELIDCLNEMLDYWTELAKKAGFDGIDFAYQHVDFAYTKNKDDSRFKYGIEYQPAYALRDFRKTNHTILNFAKSKIKNLLLYIEKKASVDLLYFIDGKRPKESLQKFDYDEIWTNIVNRKASSEKSIAGAFVDWDNTPRKGRDGFIIEGATPEKFEHYMDLQIKNVKNNYQNNMIFIFAWNEWAEGGYLEADEKNGYRYLEVIKGSLEKNSERSKK